MTGGAAGDRAFRQNRAGQRDPVVRLRPVAGLPRRRRGQGEERNLASDRAPRRLTAGRRRARTRRSDVRRRRPIRRRVPRRRVSRVRNVRAGEWRILHRRIPGRRISRRGKLRLAGRRLEDLRMARRPARRENLRDVEQARIETRRGGPDVRGQAMPIARTAPGVARKDLWRARKDLWPPGPAAVRRVSHLGYSGPPWPAFRRARVHGLEAVAGGGPGRPRRDRKRPPCLPTRRACVSGVSGVSQTC